MKSMSHTPIEPPIISVNSVSKKFCRQLKKSLFYGISDICSELLSRERNSSNLRAGEFWALNQVSFDLNKGDAIGLVGANGSGKTTLLRMISGLIKPDDGEIHVRGNIVPLIALGAGFNPILTGRENVYVNLAILGLSHDKIEAVFDDVANFAEIDEALDSPVQSYSSGMAARLGFACAVHANAEVLLIDEVLSVGDMRFRSKCYRKLAELREKGTSFILVSHNTNAILSMCNKAVYLSKGKQIMIGDPSAVMSKFEEDLSVTPAMSEGGSIFLPEKTVDDSTGLDFTALQLKNAEDECVNHALSGEPIKLELKIKCTMQHNNVIAAALIKELSGETETMLQLSSEKQGISLNFKPGESKLQIALSVCGLRPGVYTAKIYLYKDSFFMLDVIESFVFKVRSERDMNQCQFYQPVNWILSA
jgi:lipopolysaccharide transport system ATP-binding protein